MNTALTPLTPNQEKVDAAMESLTAVIPGNKTKTIGDVTIAIASLKVGSLPAVLRAVQPLQHLLMNRAVPFDPLMLFMLHTEDCLSLLAVLSKQERAWVDNLDPDDALDLFTELLEANLDFFVRRVLPLLSAKVAALTQSLLKMQASMNGPTASKG